MKRNLIKGSIINKKIQCCIEEYTYIDDNEIFIAVDGIEADKDKLNNIKDLYKKLGEDFVYEIDGFYSLYLYDKINNILILLKDKMGLKPVYYYQSGDSVYFGRDLMDVVNSYNIEKDINTEALSFYFRYHYINPPETIFKDVYKLKNGHYLIVKDGHAEDKVYWDIIDRFNNNSKNKIKNFDDAKKNIENIIKDFLQEELNKNNYNGIYLSGGIDSSLVAAISSKLSNKKINTFSIGLFDNELNEAEKSKKVAEYLGTNHHELYIGEEKMLETIKNIPYYYTEPFADASEVATVILNEFAEENGINIALTGDGADQLFCGAVIYDFLWKYNRIQKIINPFKIQLNCKIIENSKFRYVYGNTEYPAQSEFVTYEKNLNGLFKDNGQKRLEDEKRIRSSSWQEKRMIMDLNSFIADRINTKIERASNRNGIQIRSPFLSSKLIEESFRIPHKYKYHRRIKKYLLKELLYEYVPKELFSNKKRGFTIPKKKWLKNNLYEDLQRLSAKDYIEKQKIFNYDAVRSLIERIDDKKIAQILWDYYMFQLWYDTYMI